MKTLKITVRPLSVFGTPLVGDTFFGHVCWAVRERTGEGRLDALLEGYTAGKPFMVVSDAFPHGYVPRPTLPGAIFGLDVDPADRKEARRRQWLPVGDAGLPFSHWMEKASKCDVVKAEVVTQNTINRLTGTTGTGPFAPRQVERVVYRAGEQLDVYVVLDDELLDPQEVRQIFEDIGAAGYGRDASTGTGKFAVDAVVDHSWPLPAARHWLTLAPCAPDVGALEPVHCYYQPVTRFGRHGNLGVRLGVPFKRPILLMKTGACLTSTQAQRWSFHGRGLGGHASPLSAVIRGTVHQGYAPVVPLNAELP